MPNNTNQSHRLCIAPMLDWTDRHARYFLRLISPHARMYTEMVNSGAIVYGETDRFLAFNPEENPIALQLGGSNPQELKDACKKAEIYHYDEINLNVGCPSDRVQSGRFGACLMATPDHVAECIKAMQEGSSKEITIKCRTGIDDMDDFSFLEDFININAEAGCNTFIIHARKAWLTGLSPKENREIPPLHYDKVYAIKKLFPHLNIVINGGIKTAEEAQEHLQHTNGVMIGREAYQNPYSLAAFETGLYANSDIPERHDIVRKMLPYIELQLQDGAKLNHISRHMLGLFNGMKGAKAFRRYISQNAHQKGAGIEIIEHALTLVPEHVETAKRISESHE